MTCEHAALGISYALLMSVRARAAAAHGGANLLEPPRAPFEVESDSVALLSTRSPSRAAAAHVGLLAAAAIYSGFNLLLARSLSGGVSAVGFSVVREGAAIIILYGWAFCIEGPLRPPPVAHRWQFVALGAILAAFQLCFAVGVALTDGQTAALFQCIEPTTAAVIAAVLGQERLTAVKVLSAALAGGGVLLIQLAHTSEAPPRSAMSVGNVSDDLDGTTPVGLRSAHVADAMQVAETAARADDATALDRGVGCALLFMQGVGIALYCLLQRRLVLITKLPPEGQPPSVSSLATSHPDVSSLATSHPGDPPAAVTAAARPLSHAGAPPCYGDAHHTEAAPLGLSPSAGRLGSAGRAADAVAPPALAYGPVTVTAHAYASSLCVMLCAAALNTVWRLESPPPLSAASLRRLSSPLGLAAVAYAVVLTSCVGYSLRAWASRWITASTLVLYNAVQPPMTALLALAVDPASARYGSSELGGTALVMAAVWLASGAALPPSCGRCSTGSRRPIARIT